MFATVVEMKATLMGSTLTAVLFTNKSFTAAILNRALSCDVLFGI